VHDWEVDLVTSFFDLLYSLKLRQGGENKILKSVGSLLKRCMFEVRSFYHALCALLAPHFFGRVFGEIRLLREEHSLCGRRHEGKDFNFG
jgi:hypothetical protein